MQELCFLYAVFVPEPFQLAHLVFQLPAASAVFQAVDAFLLLLLDPRINLLIGNVEFLGGGVVVQAASDAVRYDGYAFFECRLSAFCHDGLTSRAGGFELLVIIILHNPDLQLTTGANPVFLADGPLRFATGKAIANSRFLEFGRVSSPSPVGEGLRSATLIVAKPSTEELGRDTGRLRQGLDASFSTVVSLNEVNLYFCRYPFFVHKMPPIR